MDLVSSLRKGDSSRGGRAEFSWDKVKDDKDRENYLGHSLMAPVGRWQKGKNLTWYADAAETGQSAEEARKEEIRRIKEAEQDALAEALGFPVERRRDPVDQKEVQKAIKESSGGTDENDDGKGLGFGKSGLKELIREDIRGQRKPENNAPREVEGYKPVGEREERRPRDEERNRDRDHRRRYRSRSSGRDRERRHRSRSAGRDREHRHRRHMSRSRSTRRHRHDDERDSRRHRERGGRSDGHRRRSKSRSRSPRHHRRH